MSVAGGSLGQKERPGLGAESVCTLIPSQWLVAYIIFIVLLYKTVFIS